MKKLIVIMSVLGLMPGFAFAGIVKGGGSSDCSTHVNYRSLYRMTLKDVGDSLNTPVTKLYRLDSHFNTGLTLEEQQINIEGLGKYGSGKIRFEIRNRCKSLNGGSKLIVSVPSQFKDSVQKEILSVIDSEATDGGISTEKDANSIVYDGEAFKLTIELSDASRVDLMENGRFAEGIKLTFLNKVTNVVLEGENKL